jgi:beta-1,2-mannobiose phosphorylase / 1,2-beta-oligomannan phosphorylase
MWGSRNSPHATGPWYGSGWLASARRMRHSAGGRGCTSLQAPWVAAVADHSLHNHTIARLDVGHRGTNRGDLPENRRRDADPRSREVFLMAIIVHRCARNPLIQPADVMPSRQDLKVVGVFNAGIVVREDEVVALLRVAEAPIDSTAEHPVVVDAVGGRFNLRRLDRAALSAQGWDFSDSRKVRSSGATEALTVRHLTTISHLRVAQSSDGEQFKVAAAPAIYPEGPLEEWGCEDPRIVEVDGQYVVTYSAVSRHGIATMMATSSDLATFTRRGLLFAPENRNVAIFPRRIGGLYYALHRPVPKMFGDPAIWIAQSADLHHWGTHSLITTTSRSGWQSGRIGAAGPPIWTESGWLSIYHAANAANRYCLGAMLFPLDEPRRVSHRLPMPILEPEADYETRGFFSEVVFSCGAVQFRGDLWIYYGAADQSLAAARFSCSELIAELLKHPVSDTGQTQR